MRVILFLIGLALSLDGLYCGAVAYMGLGEAVIVGIGIIFILWGVFYDAFREKAFLRIAKKLFSIFVALLVAYSAVICVIGNVDNASYNENYVVVLGAGLKGKEPSETLKMRLDKAIEYMNKNESATAIVSGGQGKGELISEAAAMKNYLVSNGIEHDRIITEDNSTSTYENFYYSSKLIESKGIVFVTSNFHVLRSSQMAKMNGIDTKHIGASIPIATIPAACMREFFAQIAAIRYI